MNIKQALKKKNILVDKIKQEYNRLNTYNSIESGNLRPYSATQSLENYLKLTDELVILKTAIHKANQPVYDKIFRLSEYKSIVQYLKNLNCVEGKLAGSRWGDSNETRFMESEINVVKKDQLVAEYEDKINQIQDELDYFNQVTEIQI